MGAYSIDIGLVRKLGAFESIFLLPHTQFYHFITFICPVVKVRNSAGYSNEHSAAVFNTLQLHF
jgi:hypothetical protein